MFDANHFHIEATLDITDSDKLSKHSSYFFTKKDIYSPKVVVTLFQVFPNLFPCVYNIGNFKIRILYFLQFLSLYFLQTIVCTFC